LGTLGNIFESPPEGPRGRDLHHTVRVNRAQLRGGRALAPRVPDRLDVDGMPVTRQIHPDDPPGAVVLRLPDDAPERFRLRLRGHGEARADGSPGDLFLTVIVDDSAADIALFQEDTGGVDPDWLARMMQTLGGGQAAHTGKSRQQTSDASRGATDALQKTDDRWLVPAMIVGVGVVAWLLRLAGWWPV